MDSVSTNVTTTVSSNVTSTVPINYDDKKVRWIKMNKMDYYILHTFLLVTILLFTIVIICYRHARHRSKQINTTKLAM